MRPSGPFQVKCSDLSVILEVGQLAHSLDKIHFLPKDLSVLVYHSDYYSKPYDCCAEFFVFAASGDGTFWSKTGTSSRYLGVPDTSLLEETNTQEPSSLIHL